MKIIQLRKKSDNKILLYMIIRSWNKQNLIVNK